MDSDTLKVVYKGAAKTEDPERFVQICRELHSLYISQLKLTEEQANQKITNQVIK